MTVSACLAPVRHELPNGALALLQETTTHPAVSVNLTFPAGSGYDPPALPGLAHFVSRVIDRGTALLGADELAEALESRGVALTAGASRHTFWLGCTCLTDDFEAVLALLGDVAMHPVFPAAEVETRRGEIVTAIRQDDDNPATVAGDRLLELLYPAHPYGRPARGTLETVAAIDRQALLQFHRTHFVPRGLRLIVVGDVPVEVMRRAADRTFGGWLGPEARALRPESPPRLPARQRLVVPMMGKAQVDVAYGLTALRRQDPDYYALVVMNTVLGQYGLGGRLGDSIRERQGMAYYAFSTVDAHIAEGAFIVRAGVAPEHVDRTVASIDEEIDRLLRYGVTDAELVDAKRYLIGSLPRVLETNDGIASFLQAVDFFDLGIDHDRQLPGLIDAVSGDDVARVARRVLDLERAAVVIAGPYQAGIPSAA